ncbi:hypothetical protein [Candidatus Uabimicrobium sp. HlEnr_7]|uniref:hypothetical protein n=1 Tax=Candidatus Uabimicrobium helgolandensis TaxID=3095367 RepID=UPI003555EDFE
MLDFLIYEMLERFNLPNAEIFILALYSLGLYFTFVKLGYGRSSYLLNIPIGNLIVIFDFIEIPRSFIPISVIFLILGAVNEKFNYLFIIACVFFVYVEALLALRTSQAFSKSNFFALFLFCFGAIGYIFLGFFEKVGIRKGVTRR